MAEVMRSCALRAGLSRCEGARAFTLGNPKAWLGTAYHAVLEKLAEADIEDDAVDAKTEELWTAAIEVERQGAMAHGLDSRFGPPVAWPGYHLAHAAVRLRAKEMVASRREAGRQSAARANAGDSTPAMREQRFTACNGKLVGRPDVISGDEIIDYKSGAILERDEATESEVVKAAYVRQLRIYGFLVRQALGRWLPRGVLLPLVGTGVQIELDPAQCEREAAESVALLDAYNERVRAGESINALAAPAPVTCKWCAFKLICPAFWGAAGPAWSGQLEGAAIEGVVGEPVRAIHGGAAFAISVEIQRGTETPRRAEIAPLNASIHGGVAKLVPGDAIRFVNLRVRPDGKLVPTPRTVLSRVVDLPSLVTIKEVAA
jgi:hypothetical protein